MLRIICVWMKRHQDKLQCTCWRHWQINFLVSLFDCSVSLQFCPKQSFRRWKKYSEKLVFIPYPWLNYTSPIHISVAAPLLSCPRWLTPSCQAMRIWVRQVRQPILIQFKKPKPVLYATYLSSKNQRIPTALTVLYYTWVLLLELSNLLMANNCTFSTVSTLPVPRISEAYNSAGWIWASKILMNTLQSVQFILQNAVKTAITFRLAFVIKPAAPWVVLSLKVSEKPRYLYELTTSISASP